MDSWIKLYRKLIESDIWFKKPAEWLKIWLYILLKVNYQDGKNLAKGWGLFRRPWERITDESSAAHITKFQWDGCIRFLRGSKMITTQKTTRGSIIKVLKYNEYQAESVVENNTKNETETKQKRNRNDTILKEGLRTIKNIKKSTITPSQIQNIIFQFPDDIKPLVFDYIDITRLQNKTMKLNIGKEFRLTNELYLLWSQYEGNEVDERDFRQALKTTISNEAPNINYVRKVIHGIIRKRSVRLKRGAR